MKDIIRMKKSSAELKKEHLEFWVKGILKQVEGHPQIPEYQTTALLMALFLNKMSDKERSYLTAAMRDSGTVLNFDYLGPNVKVIDKHSSGGLGDKTSLILAPLIAASGIAIVPMIAGRGLAHTGGTLDKLESIPGYNVRLTEEQMHESIKSVGTFIAGQTARMAPADRVIYALRDATETVQDVSLITSSILSKKLSEGIHYLTMDVKWGLGAFLTQKEEGQALARSLVNTASGVGGVTCEGILTRMDFPLGVMCGNACEVEECIRAMEPGSNYAQMIGTRIVFDEHALGYVKLAGDGKIHCPEETLMLITMVLAVNMCTQCGVPPLEAFNKMKEVWQSGACLQRFQEIVEKQGGDLNAFRERSVPVWKRLMDDEKFQNDPNIYVLRAPADRPTKIKAFNGVFLGNTLNKVGVGRITAADKLNYDVSLRMLVYPDIVLQPNQPIVAIYHPDVSALQLLEREIPKIVELTDDLNWVDDEPLITEIITKN